MPSPANRVVADFMGLVNLVPARVMRPVANGGGRIGLGADLALDVAALDGLKPGDDVDVAIRPENIRLSDGRNQERVRATDQRAHLSRQHQRVLRQPDSVRRFGYRPIRATFRGRRQGCGRGRRHANAASSAGSDT